VQTFDADNLSIADMNLDDNEVTSAATRVRMSPRINPVMADVVAAFQAPEDELKLGGAYRMGAEMFADNLPATTPEADAARTRRALIAREVTSGAVTKDGFEHSKFPSVIAVTDAGNTLLLRQTA
jgi:hypothetical protein